jgi:hypothetical protein
MTPARIWLSLGLAVVAGCQSLGNQSAVTGRLPDWSGVWQAIPGAGADAQTFGSPRSDPDPGIIQLTPLALARRDAMRRGGSFVPAKSVCLSTAMPLEMGTTGVAIEFIIARDRVTVISENGFVRRIYTDGRPLPQDPDPTYAGHSIGHWEGATLLTDTNGIIRSELGPYVVTAGNTRVRERIQRLDANTLLIEFTVTDSDYLARPWIYTRRYERLDRPMGEYVCAQNNRDNNREVDLTPPPE